MKLVKESELQIGTTYQDIKGIVLLKYEGQSRYGHFCFTSSNNDKYCEAEYDEENIKGDNIIGFMFMPKIFHIEKQIPKMPYELHLN
jgi:hypothetical protein